MGEERRHLRVLVAIAVDMARAVGVGRLAHPEPTPAYDARDVGRTDPRHRRAVRQARVEEGLRLGDPDRRHVPPQPRRPIEGADDDRDDEDDQGHPEDGGLEDRKGAQPLEHADRRRAEDRVIAGADLVHRRGVVAGRAEREVGQLLEGHPDDREDRQEDDLDDGEVDRRQEPPQPLPELGQWVGRRAGGRGRANSGRRRHDARSLDADGGLLDRSGHVTRDRQRGREVVLEILEVLEAHRDPQQARGDAGVGELGVGHLAL